MLLHTTSRIPRATIEYSPFAPLTAFRISPKKSCGSAKHLRESSTKPHTFSFQSRRRMRDLLMRVRNDVSRQSLFVTLTLPGQQAHKYEHEETKEWLHRFVKWIRYKYPCAEYVWKMEYHKSGKPHFHLLIFNVAGPSLFKRRALAKWSSIVASSDFLHRANGVHVISKAGCGSFVYLLKYATKPAEVEGKYYGRFWGRSDNLTSIHAPFFFIPVTFDACFKMYRILRKVFSIRSPHMHSIRYLVIEKPEIIPKLIRLFAPESYPSFLAQNNACSLAAVPR